MIEWSLFFASRDVKKFESTQEQDVEQVSLLSELMLVQNYWFCVNAERGTVNKSEGI